ncbi:hypothetical protein FB639_003696, partial [Coemansia asiatica]
MSTGPSPLFFPLHPSPRLVAEMTGLSLEQSALEVSQQRNLKRMLRRIRASRQKAPAAGSSPRNGLRHHIGAAIRRHMPSLTLPSATISHAHLANEHDRANRIEAPDSSSGWGSEEDDDGISPRKMDIFMDISDSPSAKELQARVAHLFNRVFEPKPEILANHVEIQRLSGAMTNSVFMVTISPAPVVPASSHLSHVHKWTHLRSNSHGKRKDAESKSKIVLPAKYLLRVYGTGVDEFLLRDKELYWLSQLTSLGFGPRLYGIFGNGRLEEFLESTTLTKDDIRDPSTSKHIARRMCELHSLVSYYRPFKSSSSNSDSHGKSLDVTSSMASVSSLAQGVDLTGYPELWSNIDSWMALVQKKWARIVQVCAKNPQCMEILDNWTRVEQAVDKMRKTI